MSKLRPTRIKITTNQQGEKSYTPQHRGGVFSLFRWYDFSDCHGCSALEHTNPYSFSHFKTYDVIEQAQEDIDNYIAAFNKEAYFRKRKTIVSTEYVKYP